MICPENWGIPSKFGTNPRQFFWRSSHAAPSHASRSSQRTVKASFLEGKTKGGHCHWCEMISPTKFQSIRNSKKRQQTARHSQQHVNLVAKSGLNWKLGNWVRSTTNREVAERVRFNQQKLGHRWKVALNSRWPATPLVKGQGYVKFQQQLRPILLVQIPINIY